MIQLDFGDHRPLYEQIRDKIKDLIISGALRENEKIPSVRELAQSLAINPNTIQKAYHELESGGFIYSQRAKGSFVAPAARARVRTDENELLAEVEAKVLELFFLGVPKSSVTEVIDRIYEGGVKNDKGD